MGSKDSWTNRVLSERLAKHQISTLRFDFFGHGQSDGGLKGLLLTTLVAQTDSVMALMHGYGFAHIALRGSSFGGWKRQLSSPRGAPGWSRYRFSIERRQMKAGAENGRSHQLGLGLIAGFLGTAAMTVAMVALHRRLPPEQQGPLPPYHISMAVAERVGIKRYLSPNSRFATTLALHFAYGSAVGSLYFPFARLLPGPYPLKGLLFGGLVWTGSYLGWLPVTGLLTPATRHPAGRNCLMIAVHLVWGSVIALAIQRFIPARHPTMEVK